MTESFRKFRSILQEKMSVFLQFRISTGRTGLKVAPSFFCKALEKNKTSVWHYIKMALNAVNPATGLYGQICTTLREPK